MKRKEVRAAVIFVAAMAVIGIFGFFCGWATWELQHCGMDFAQIGRGIRAWFAAVTPVFYVVGSVLAFVAAVVSLVICKKQAAAWDGEDEAWIAQVERRVYIPNVIITVASGLNLFLYPFLIYLMDEAAEPYMFVLVINCVWTTVVQEQMVRLEKRINPEKNGSAYSIHFLKEWEESCDEAQKQMMYEAGYRAYKVANYLCMAMWIVAFVGVIAFHTGILAMLLVCIIWLVTTLTYVLTAKKLEA